MASPREVAALFAPAGSLSRARGGYEHRTGQARMAEAVARALEEGRHLVVEAGTGTGKTLAYLVPALLAEAPVLLSTGTKALQDQLLERELPVALKAIGAPREVTVLKGRENYLCLKRLGELEAEPRLDLAAEVPLWPRLVAWSRTTGHGDRAEVAGLPDVSPLWSRLDGRAETCTGTKCPRYDACFVYRARRAAARAQAVVVNHHLLFSDLALRREERGSVLPDAPFLVLDEAHMIEEAAASHFGARLSARMTADLARDARNEFERVAGAVEAASLLERAARDFFRAARPPAGVRGRVALGPERARGDLRPLADALLDALEATRAALEGPGERAEERALVAGRALAQQGALDDLLDARRPGEVVTVEAQGKDGAVIASWPIEVGALLEEILGNGFQSVVATSATLAIAGSLDRARDRLGLSGADALVVASPFRYREQAALYVPRAGFPAPDDSRFAERALREIEELVRISRGRALVLFASHRALEHAARELPRRLDYPVLVQGEAPRERLIERFREEVHSVLLGTASFRQGIDVPGEALSLVVVDKLPFAVPDDPVVAAKGAAIRERGGDPFAEEQLPEAILSLRQALGRLIRSQQDRGLLALLDVRVRTRRYGRQVLASLPPWTLLDDLDQARTWFRVVDG